MASIHEGKWKNAVSQVLEQFEIEELMKEQEEAIRAFLGGSNVFVNLPTGFGKSLIFQCLPIAYDAMKSLPRGSSLLVVVSPLRSLMEDQVSYLQNLGIPAISVGEHTDDEMIQQVINGNFILVFVSPECLLSTSTWRGVFNDERFKEMLIGFAIDEAHCITQWGLPGDKKTAFRKWYGCLGELTSLIPEGCNIMVLTATATSATKQQILRTVNLSTHNVKVIEQSPDRPNLFYDKVYLDKNQPIEDAFGSLIEELTTLGKDTPRAIIYCQTRKQCSLLFTIFEIYLGKRLYHGEKKPQNRLVEMYHASTPGVVKKHISENMSKCEGHIRVVISTVAFGMGVNCKKVRRILHFGPSKSIEMYIQECGRAGRDGEPSTCILLYNGLLSTFCDNDIKTYIEAEVCLRKLMMQHFSDKHSTQQENSFPLHSCCKICQAKCTCGECPVMWQLGLDGGKNLQCSYLHRSENCQTLARVVTNENRAMLHEKLLAFQQSLQRNIEVCTMVSCPNVILEFNDFHIQQILRNCHSIFTLQDVVKSVEIWRDHYAVGILKAIKDIFQDIDFPSLEEQLEFNETDFSEWSNIRDDSSLLHFFDSQDFDGIESSMETDKSC